MTKTAEGKWVRTKTPDQARKDAVAKYDSRGVQLQAELSAMLKMVRMQREKLEADMHSGFGYKEGGFDIKMIQAAKELSLAYSRLTEAEIKLNKSLRDLAEMLTPEEELQAVRQYIRDMELTDRSAFFKEEIDWHNEQREKQKTLGAPMNAERVL